MDISMFPSRWSLRKSQQKVARDCCNQYICYLQSQLNNHNVSYCSFAAFRQHDNTPHPLNFERYSETFKETISTQAKDNSSYRGHQRVVSTPEQKDETNTKTVWFQGGLEASQVSDQGGVVQNCVNLEKRLLLLVEELPALVDKHSQHRTSIENRLVHLEREFAASAGKYDQQTTLTERVMRLEDKIDTTILKYFDDHHERLKRLEKQNYAKDIADTKLKISELADDWIDFDVRLDDLGDALKVWMPDSKVGDDGVTTQDIWTDDDESIQVHGLIGIVKEAVGDDDFINAEFREPYGTIGTWCGLEKRK